MIQKVVSGPNIQKPGGDPEKQNRPRHPDPQPD